MKKDISNYAILVITEEVNLYHIIDIDRFWDKFETLEEWYEYGWYTREAVPKEEEEYTIQRGSPSDENNTIIFPVPTTLYTLIDN